MFVTTIFAFVLHILLFAPILAGVAGCVFIILRITIFRSEKFKRDYILLSIFAIIFGYVALMAVQTLNDPLYWNGISRWKQPFIYHIANGDYSKVKSALKNGIDANVRKDNQEGTYKTAFQVACDYGQVEIAVLLLEYGADMDAFDSRGVSSLEYVINMFEESDDLQYQQSVLALIKTMLENGVDTERTKDTLKQTPLIQICQKASSFSPPAYVYDLVGLFIQHNANINAQDLSDQTPLMYACGAGTGINSKLSALLIDNGADISMRSRENLSASDYLQKNYEQNNPLLNSNTSYPIDDYLYQYSQIMELLQERQ